MVRSPVKCVHVGLNCDDVMMNIRQTDLIILTTLPYTKMTLYLAQFRYLGTTVTDQNFIQEEIKRRWNSGNACCHSVQNLLSSHLCLKT
jgi:hypothetical protein